MYIYIYIYIYIYTLYFGKRQNSEKKNGHFAKAI